MDRREAIKRTAILMGGVMSASVMTGVLNGCKATPQGPNWKPMVFSPEQGQLVAEMAERIIPKTATPGAKDAFVHEYMDLMVKEVFNAEKKTEFLSGLDAVEAKAKTKFKKSFVAASPEEMDALLTELESAAKDAKEGPDSFFNLFKQMTITGFFTSEAGATEVLKYEPVPGPYQGCVPLAKVGGTWAS